MSPSVDPRALSKRPEPPLAEPYYGIAFSQAVARAFRKYSTFTGRASISEGVWFGAFVAGVTLLLRILRALTEQNPFSLGPFGWLNLLFVAAVALPSLALNVRRLHDTGRPGTYVLLHLIPLIGTIVVIVYLLSPTSPIAGRFGPPSQSGSAGDVSSADSRSSSPGLTKRAASGRSRKAPSLAVVASAAAALVLVVALVAYGSHRLNQLPPYQNPNGPDPDPSGCYYANDPARPVNHVDPPSCFPSDTPVASATCAEAENNPYANGDTCSQAPDPVSEPPSQMPTPPPDAIVCSADPEGEPLHSTARGNDHTTCPFAENVETAYADAGGTGQSLMVRAHSPVTGKNYTMSCDLYEEGVVECTGGVDAEVYLY